MEETHPRHLVNENHIFYFFMILKETSSGPRNPLGIFLHVLVNANAGLSDMKGRQMSFLNQKNVHNS